MAKTYPDELADWVKARAAQKQRQDKHMVAFLAVRSDVQAALDAGYAMKTIWEHMTETGRLHSRYETFTQHVKRYIRSASDPSTHTPPAPPPTRNDPKVGGFKFNPTPKKEDLL